MNFGKIFAFFAIAVVVLLLAVRLYGSVAFADSGEMRALEVSAKSSPDAQNHLFAFLKEHPTPTWNEFYDESKIVKQLVDRDHAREVTGDPTIKADFEKEIEADKRNAEAMSRPMETPFGFAMSPAQGFALVLLMVVIGIGLAYYQRMTSRY